MARRIALLAALAPLILPAVAGAATPARFFAGTPIDGPSADIQSLGDLDLARDGTGALAYVKRVGGVDHIFVSRLVNGAFQPPEQVDAGLAGAGSQPVVAASDGGRLVVAFVSGGEIFTTVRPAGAPGYTALQQIAAVGSDPAVDMSINGVAYVAYTSNGDLQAIRLERNATTFNGVPGPLDITRLPPRGWARPAQDRGRRRRRRHGRMGRERPRLRAPALRAAPVDCAAGRGRERRRARHLQRGRLELRVGRVPPGRLAVARRLVGSQFDPPVTLQGNEGVDAPRIAINGRGVGYAGIGGATRSAPTARC